MNRKSHLIALDLDGTLLTNNKDISTYTKEVILKAKEMGHIVVIATGRSHLMSMHYYDLLSLDTAMINYNGSYIHHPYDKTWEPVHHPVPKKTALHIVDACYELNVNNIWVESHHNILLDRHDQHIIDVFHATHQSNKALPLTVGSIRKQLQEDPTSLIIQPHDYHIKDLQVHLDDHFSEIIHHRQWGAPWNFFEIAKRGMSKAYGLKKLSRYYNIPQERIIAFGDEDNDLEMIDYAGIGVAMDNGIEELKSIADHITLTNEADGVGTFLADYLKLQVKTG